MSLGFENEAHLPIYPKQKMGFEEPELSWRTIADDAHLGQPWLWHVSGPQSTLATLTEKK